MIKKLSISDIKLIFEVLDVNIDFIQMNSQIQYHRDLTYILKCELEKLGFECLIDNDFTKTDDEIETKLYIRLEIMGKKKFYQMTNYSEFVDLIIAESYEHEIFDDIVNRIKMKGLV